MVYVFIADGFEEIETFAPIDILLRSDISLKTVGINVKEVKSKHGIQIKTDLSEEEVDLSHAEMIILPGGPGHKILGESAFVSEAIDYCVKNNIYIAAICASPSILASKGLLKQKAAVCHPSVETKMNGAIIKDIPVNIDIKNKIITSRGAGTAFQFAFTICRLLKGDIMVQKIMGDICYDG